MFKQCILLFNIYYLYSTNKCVRAHTHTHTHTHKLINKYMCIYTYICIHTHTHTHQTHQNRTFELHMQSLPHFINNTDFTIE